MRILGGTDSLRQGFSLDVWYLDLPLLDGFSDIAAAIQADMTQKRCIVVPKFSPKLSVEVPLVSLLSESSLRLDMRQTARLVQPLVDQNTLGSPLIWLLKPPTGS